MYKTSDYLRNGVLYLNNIIRPHHKRLSTLMIYSTTKCQSRCKHCSIWQKPEEHLSLRMIKMIMASQCVTKNTVVGLEGGEFLLHPEANAIMEWFKDNHPNYTLLSNCLAPQKVIEAVRLYHPSHLYVSLDGNKETYKAMRGCNGHDKVLEVIETLKDEVPVSLMFCLSPWNTFEDMDYVIGLAKRYDVDVRIGIYGTMDFFDTTADLLSADMAHYIQNIPKSIHWTKFSIREKLPRCSASIQENAMVAGSTSIASMTLSCCVILKRFFLRASSKFSMVNTNGQAIEQRLTENISKRLVFNGTH